MKKINIKIIIISVVIALFFLLGIPIIINELYKLNKGYITVWGAADVLSFYSVILSGIITICIFCATIFYSKKDTERQLNFYLSQSCVPFFVIDTVENNGDIYIRNIDNTWKKTIILNLSSSSKDLKFISANDEIIKFNIKNVGEGLALNLNCVKQFKGNNIVNYNYQVVNKESIITVEFKLREYLNLNPIDENETNLTVEYQNTSGVCFSQEIIIKLKKDLSNRRIKISIPEMSPRKNLSENT